MKDSHKTEEEIIAELDSLRKDTLVKFLREQLGKPYQYAVDSEAVGYAAFDCSSLIQSAYARIGLRIPRTSISQATWFGRIIEEQDDYEIGDLIFFIDDAVRRNPLYEDGIGHVAIYSGEGNIIHAVDGERYSGVLEESLDDFSMIRAAVAENGETDLIVSKRIFEGNVYYHEGFANPLIVSIE